MLYRELFNKDVISKNFNNDKLSHALFGKQTYPIKREKINVEKGEFLIHENELHDSIYLVVEGLFSVRKSLHIIRIVGKKNFIGFDSILGNENSFFTVEALRDATLWRFSKMDVICKLMSKQEGLFYLYNEMKSINGHLIQQNMFLRKSSKTRILNNMILLGKQYGEENSKFITLPECLSKQIIANYSNATQATMRVICKQLSNDSILEETHQLMINKSRVKEYKNLAMLL